MENERNCQACVKRFLKKFKATWKDADGRLATLIDVDINGYEFGKDVEDFWHLDKKLISIEEIS